MPHNISSIQIIGTQRSGSNLLRLILNQFDEISAPHPPHVLKTFGALLDAYGDLNNDNNFKLLARDIADFVNANPVSWNLRKIEAGELLARARNRSLLSLYEMLYVIKAELDGASIWCNKSMFNEYYAEKIEEEGIHPFYIYLFRDGRDVAASFKNTIIGPKHIYFIAKAWKNDQERALQVRELVGDARFFMMKYEELIRVPEQVLRELSLRLGLAYSTRLLQYYASSESQKTASSGEMWKNVAKPIIANNMGKYRHELSGEEIEIFESVAGECLRHLGYKTDGEINTGKQYDKQQVEDFERLNLKLQAEARKAAPNSDKLLRSKQELVLEKIKNRFSL